MDQSIAATPQFRKVRLRHTHSLEITIMWLLGKSTGCHLCCWMNCCGPTPTGCCEKKHTFDWLLWISAACCAGAVGLVLAGVHTGVAGRLSHAITMLLSQMWWGLLLGIVAVGLLERVPREVVSASLGSRPGAAGIARAMFAGLLLDLCNHGILLVAMSLYRRGASLGQTLAFLIASPWNSVALTLILVGLIGLPWTLLFVFGSALIAFLTGIVVETLTSRGKLPANPNRVDLPEGFKIWPALLSAICRPEIWSASGIARTAITGLRESRMILKWLLFGTVAAGIIQTFVPTDILRQWFGPSLGGLMLTLLAATIIEVCSEGSTPIAADLFTRGAAPGNAFTFLMAGAATDYTEMMSLRETTGRWLTTLILPLFTIPQVLALALLMNAAR